MVEYLWILIFLNYLCLVSKHWYLINSRRGKKDPFQDHDTRFAYLLDFICIHTVYPKKYAHGFCFAVLCCGYTLTDFPISIRLTSLALWHSNDCPSASKATLMNMDKYFKWIHYERLHNHNKAKHNKTVCIFLGMYRTCFNSSPGNHNQEFPIFAGIGVNLLLYISLCGRYFFLLARMQFTKNNTSKIEITYVNFLWYFYLHPGQQTFMFSLLANCLFGGNIHKKYIDMYHEKFRFFLQIWAALVRLIQNPVIKHWLWILPAEWFSFPKMFNLYLCQTFSLPWIWRFCRKKIPFYWN